MHELSIAMNLVEIATAEARRRELPPIVAVHVRVGRLSSVDEESLRFCWQAATDGTPLADSRLVVESVAVAVRCPSCGEREPPSILDLRCPDCGLPTAAVVRGRELDLVGLEVADARTSPAAAGEVGPAGGAAQRAPAGEPGSTPTGRARTLARSLLQRGSTEGEPTR